MFTMFESSSICLLYLLNYLFSSVHVFKPCTSKSGNSEVYILCLRYTGKLEFNFMLQKFLKRYENQEELKESMFSFEDIPEMFIVQIQESSKFFMDKQITTITNNICCYNQKLPDEHRKNEFIKNAIGRYFLLKYKIKPTPSKLIPQNFQKELRCDFSNVLSILNSFLQCNNNVTLDFQVGKQIEEIIYSEFCDCSLLKMLRNTNVELTTSFFDQLKQIEICNTDVIIYINFINDNKLFVNKLFSDFEIIVNTLNSSDRFILVGSLFLSRFEASLIYLLMLCFKSVQYWSSGIIILCNPTEKASKIAVLFNNIRSELNNLRKENVNEFDAFLLNVLPLHLLYDGAFKTCLTYYNNSTLQYCFMKLGIKEINDFA